MTFATRGTTALITGASSGLGAEFAHEFARRGADVVLVARRADRLDSLAERIRDGLGVRAHVVPRDLTEPDAAERLRAELELRGLHVDHLVNSAGFGVLGAFAEADRGRTADLVRLNVGALVDLTHGFLPSVIASGRGSVVNVASTAGYQPCPSMAVYGASKAFVLHFTEAIAYELRDRDVTVLALSPGPTRTEFLDVVGADDVPTGGMQSAAQVVAAAFRSLDRRSPPPSVVSGRLNALVALTAKLLPRRAALTVTGRALGA